MTQDRHPDPPVADVQSVEFRLLFRELLRFRLAGNLALEGPALHINLVQLQEEARSKVRFQDRGWQEAVETIIPVSKLDRVEVRDGTLLNLSADSEDKPPPADPDRHARQERAEYRGGQGGLSLAGEPGGGPVRHRPSQFFGGGLPARTCTPRVQGRLQLEQVPLDRLGPRSGTTSCRPGGDALPGRVDRSQPRGTRARLASLQLDGLELDYLTSLPPGPPKRSMGARPWPWRGRCARRQG